MSRMLDPVAAAGNATEAIDRVAENADADWLERAFGCLTGLAQINPELHADDLWLALGEDIPHERRALGAVVQRAVREGILESTDRVRRSALARCHGHLRPLWRSKIYGTSVSA